jgi:hypothetical protein
LASNILKESTTVTIRLWIDRGYITIVGTYAPEEGQAKDTQEFYETLQDIWGSTHILDLAVVQGQWSAIRPGRMAPGERGLSTYWIGGWVGQRTSLDDVERRKVSHLPHLAHSQSPY